MAGAIFESQISDPSLDEGSIAARALGFVRSEMFRRAFSGGMALVEETATYLDGPGREEFRARWPAGPPSPMRARACA